jgi:hypothetical protein
MSNSPSRVRGRRAYPDTRRFLAEAAPAALQEWADSFTKEDKEVLVRFVAKADSPVAASGKPPVAPVSVAGFLKAVREARALAEGDRSALLSLFDRLVGPGGKGSLVAGILWDHLPAGYQGGRAARSKGGGRSSPALTRKNRPVRGFAVVESSEKPWVREPNYRRWLRKLHRHTAKVRREGEKEHPANLCIDSDLCKGDLGIPRKLMPQFTSAKDIESFVAFAKHGYGIGSRRATRRAGQLRPSQEEINRERVEDVADEIRYKKLDPSVPLIVSQDGYVIDGHHRWAAFKKDQPAKKLPVLLVEAPARDVLSVAATWGAKHHQF